MMNDTTHETPSESIVEQCAVSLKRGFFSKLLYHVIIPVMSRGDKSNLTPQASFEKLVGGYERSAASLLQEGETDRAILAWREAALICLIGIRGVKDETRGRENIRRVLAVAPSWRA